MAVIVEIDKNGKFLFESIKGLGSSEEEKKVAVQLNERIKKEMTKLDAKIHNSNSSTTSRSRNKVAAYWEFGYVLRKIFFESGLVDPAEKKLFWLNVRIHAPASLLAKDRGPNRSHVGYCFRLAGYPKKFALKREWSEWVYLFDSPSINSEERFDEWDKKKIQEAEDYTTRENTRMFIQCLNAILKDVETKDLDSNELERCYDGAWALSKELMREVQNADSDTFKKKLKQIINNQRASTGQLIDGSIPPEKFSKNIVSNI